MELQVVGAGLGRTGTTSLKVALERLTGGPCYHMFEVIEHPQSVPVWHRVVRGESSDWDSLLGRYTASVDWPAAAYWPELAAANPSAIVLLSTRSSPQTWWDSMEKTIVSTLTKEVPPHNHTLAAHRAMVLDMLDRRFTPHWSDPEAAMSAYERHNDRVREEVPPQRLVEWQPGNGWEPICEALRLPVPEDPFPHENTSEEFLRNVERGRLETAGD